MEPVKLGRIIKGDNAGRDAVHIAIAPVRAAQILQPGERIGFVDEDQLLVGRVTDYVGIVDPFMGKPVMPGQDFYMCLFPGTTTSLTHVWKHPSFKEEGERVLQ
jgi:hypothetical protein